MADNDNINKYIRKKNDMRVDYHNYLMKSLGISRYVFFEKYKEDATKLFNMLWEETNYYKLKLWQY